MSRVALVTGGTRGIGAAISKALKQAGYRVAANYAGNDVAAEKFKSETGIPVFKWDVSSYEDCVAGVKKVEAELGPIEVLVNNAGITRDGAMHKMAPEQWKEVISTNLDSFFFVTRTVLQDMLINKHGRIINVVSLSGQKGHPGQVNYSAAKAGVIAASKALAMEIGKKKVTVNCVAPGFIASDMTKDLDEAMLKKMVPLNRFGQVEEVAEVISFLASEKSAYITGEVISINGGLHS